MAGKHFSDLLISPGTIAGGPDPDDGMVLFRTGDDNAYPDTIANILDPQLSGSVYQMLGFTIADVLEVEAATKAARVTLSRRDVGAQAESFIVTHHSIGLTPTLTGTSTGIQGVCALAWWNSNGVAVLNRVTASLYTSAISGTFSAGSPPQLALYQANPVWGASSFAATQVVLPPVLNGPAPVVNGPNYNSLRGSQHPPQLIIAQSATTVLPYAANLTNSLGIVMGGPGSAIKTHIPPCYLFDPHNTGDEPYVMAGGTGFVLFINHPPVTTSQTLKATVNIQWDEWIPCPSDL